MRFYRIRKNFTAILISLGKKKNCFPNWKKLNASVLICVSLLGRGKNLTQNLLPES